MRLAILPNRIYLLILLCWFALPAGCSQDASDIGPTVPVIGKVSVAGLPLRSGSVSFRPDATRGNESLHEPAGQIMEDGTYRLRTGSKDGAPPGWYRVAVVATEPADPYGPSPYKAPRSLVDVRYATIETSGLSIEVVESPTPGAYDLNLDK